MRPILLAIPLAALNACAATEAERFNHRMERDRQFEESAAQRQACEENPSSAWMCTSPSKRANDRYPWLYCSCVDSVSAFE